MHQRVGLDALGVPREIVGEIGLVHGRFKLAAEVEHEALDMPGRFDHMRGRGDPERGAQRPVGGDVAAMVPVRVGLQVDRPLGPRRPQGLVQVDQFGLRFRRQEPSEPRAGRVGQVRERPVQRVGMDRDLFRHDRVDVGRVQRFRPADAGFDQPHPAA